MRRTTTALCTLLLVVGTTLESLAFQGIAKTTVLTGQTPPPKSRVDPPLSELSMDLSSFFSDLLVIPDVRVLRYIQLMLTDPENTPILLSAVSSFLVLAGIWSTTPEDATVRQSSSSTHLGYASTEGATTFQATTTMEPPTTTADPYQQPQRSFRGRNARGSSVTNPPAAAKLPAMQDRYQPLSYGPMNRPGGTSPLKTIWTAASTVEKPVVAEPQPSPSTPTRDLSNTFDGPSANRNELDWTKENPRTGRASPSTPVVNTQPPKRFSASQQSNTLDGPLLANQNAFDWAQAGEKSSQRLNERAAPQLYAPTTISSWSACSYLESLMGSVPTMPRKQSSYAPSRFVMAVPNALGNSYLEAMGMGSNRGADMRPVSQGTTGTAQQQDSGSFLASSSAKRKESSYAPTKASAVTKVTGNALGSSYFAAMGRSAPTTVYQYSPTELAARAGLHSAVATSPDMYSSDSPSSSLAQGSYLDTVGGGTSSPRKEVSYAPTKPSVMTKPMGNAMGSTYFASMGAIIPPSFSYLLSDEPEPPTAGAMKPYLSTLTKEEDSSTTRRSSYAPTKSGVGKMSSTTVGSSYLQMMGSTANKSPLNADPSVPSRRSMQNTASPSLDATRHSSGTAATEVVSYLDVLSGGKQSSSLPVKRSFAPTQPSVSNKSGTTIGSSYLSSLGR